MRQNHTSLPITLFVRTIILLYVILTTKPSFAQVPPVEARCAYCGACWDCQHKSTCRYYSAPSNSSPGQSEEQIEAEKKAKEEADRKARAEAERKKREIEEKKRAEEARKKAEEEKRKKENDALVKRLGAKTTKDIGIGISENTAKYGLQKAKTLADGYVKSSLVHFNGDIYCIHLTNISNVNYKVWYRVFDHEKTFVETVTLVNAKSEVSKYRKCNSSCAVEITKLEEF